MKEWIQKTAIALLAGLAIGAGVMYGLLSGCEMKKENAILKEQAIDRSERETMTADIVSDNEKARRTIHKTMRSIHAKTEIRIDDDDNVILPASAVRLHDDAVLQRISCSSGIPDAGTPPDGTGS